MIQENRNLFKSAERKLLLQIKINDFLPDFLSGKRKSLNLESEK